MRSHLFVAVVVLALAGCPEVKPPVTMNDTENCTNHIDDNGDGKIDCLDPKCIDTSACVFGEICDNARDDNNNGKIDCADPQCEGQGCGLSCLCVGGVKQIFDGSKDGGMRDSGVVTVADSGVRDSGVVVVIDAGVCGGCGAGCTCVGGVKTESNCGDLADNDSDLSTDCADTDCASQSCGTGCLCAGGRKTETLCNDGIDNNGTGGTDCADSDCTSQSCGTGCLCAGGRKTETLCNDGIDNNGAGGTDCADSDCTGQSCGAGCQCAALVKKEVLCSDLNDNDGDGLTDCTDPDCVGAGTEVCNDGIDNTCDQAVDCADSKCTGDSKCSGVNDGLPCRTDGQCAGGLCYSEANTGLPNGACANAINCTVGSNAGCHGTSICLAVSGSSRTECRIPCTGDGLGSSGKCRVGFACVDPDEPKNAANNNNFCIALCTKDSECGTIASGYGCNLASKRCESKVKTALAYGADCTTSSQCLGGVCLVNLPGNSNGYCTGPCRNDLKVCDTGGYCDVTSTAGDNVSLCLKSCNFFSDCKRADREGCWQITPRQSGAACQCLPATVSFSAQPAYGDTCCNGAPSSGTTCP